MWQPWASLIVEPVPCLNIDPDSLYPGGVGCGKKSCARCGGNGDLSRRYKWIETRSWPAPTSLIGERIAIHAAVRKTNSAELESVFGERMPLEFIARMRVGVVVGTAVLAGCVPMVPFETGPSRSREPRLEVGDDILRLFRDGGMVIEGVTDQRRYGIFEPGRWAWLLSDVERFTYPIVATGRQRVWNWDG